METFRLPLFPLPLVLFPGAILPLHIFEPRYRSLVATVLEGDGRFGLVYHDPDESGPFLNQSGEVGTIARIRRHQPFPDGRSLILVRGTSRFEIQAELASDAPYYEALVAPYEDQSPSDPQQLLARRKRSLALFKHVLQTLPHVPEALPPLSRKRELSFRLAATIRMDPFWQQELLEMREEMARLDRLDPVFQSGIERWWEQRKSLA